MSISRLGICTRYGLHEATYAAMRVARWFESRGGAASLFAPQPTCPRYDLPTAYQPLSPPQTLFTKWARGHDAVLWTHVPQIEQLLWTSSQGIKTVILALWAEISGMDTAALRAADCVLCPFALMTDLLHRCGVKRAVTIPWDTGDPLVQPCGSADIVRVLLPIYDGNVHRIERTALMVLGRAVARFPYVTASLFYSASSASPDALRCWRDYRRMFPEQIFAFSGIGPAYRPAVFQQYDLVFWPTQFESIGLVGLTAVAAGAPVLAFDFPGTRECLNRHNSLLSPTRSRHGSNGMPVVNDPDYVAIEAGLHELLRNRSLLSSLRQSVLRGAVSRRRLFEDVLVKVFPV